MITITIIIIPHDADEMFLGRRISIVVIDMNNLLENMMYALYPFHIISYHIIDVLD